MTETGSAPEPQPQPSPVPVKPHWTMLSVVVFAIGLLILVPSGLCTALVGLPLIFFDPFSILELVLISGPPIAIGWGLVYAGLKMRRRD